MTHFPDELIEAARAMWDKWYPESSWKEENFPEFCQAFAAGLRSFVPVKEKVLDAAYHASDEWWRDDIFQQQFTAAITYLTGDGK